MNPISNQTFMIPCAYALLLNKSQDIYAEMIDSIELAALNRNYVLNP